MTNIFSAFFYKIRKDLSVRIILFIGLGFSIFIPLILFLVDVGISKIDGGDTIEHMLCTGQGLLVSSWSPTQNFGIAIPINLITFTVLEFTNGTIRNKIISGYSKTKIYLGLYFTGVLYTLALISSYVLICFGLGCAFGGFKPNGETFPIDPDNIEDAAKKAWDAFNEYARRTPEVIGWHLWSWSTFEPTLKPILTPEVGKEISDESDKIAAYYGGPGGHWTGD